MRAIFSPLCGFIIEKPRYEYLFRVSRRMAATKKFVNSPDRAVDDSIRGLISANANLSVLESCKRVVFRSDLRECNKRNVMLVAGGGSGHEPFAAGFVGKGLLSAAVCGNIFASPPTSHITATLEDLKSKHGVIVFVINYTGDCLNFGLAIERFNTHRTTEGSARMVVISDDVALEGRQEGKGVGRRGLAGSMFIMKIAGAMAEQGTNADTIAEISQRINERIGTIGVSMSACSIPGKGPMFKLSDEEMELGLGIHGEPGCERISLKTASEVADLLLKRLEQSDKKCLQKGKKIAVILNNLGGTSQIEMNIMAGEIINWLCEHDYIVTRFYYGTLMTSLDGHGISISVLRIDEERWIELLDAETDAPAWSVTKVTPGDRIHMKQLPHTEPPKTKVADIGVALSAAETECFKRCIKSACSAIISAKEELNKLDSRSGDGDCGTTLAHGAHKVLSSLESNELCCSRPQTAFLQLSQIFEDDVGGTAGALYALMFSAASQRFGFSASGEDWHAALRGALQAIMRYGHAQPGYRSMVDPLHNAVYSIKNDSYEKADWEKLVKAAEKGALATKDMRAQCGRASYTAVDAQTEPDPGAIAVAKWIRAVFTAAYA